uniref:DUF4218 domain-containing protein n=1 Tax=Tanacetum cinerariifolium TaxID=118510 RepID=A0A6L2KVN9_TANCI|nr:hypothetical protein [Tanacetum cinerariifolium]
MDKSWMRTSRTKKQYIDGVEAFIKYALHNLQKMRNIDPRVEEVQFYLFNYGSDLSYTKWDKHGEKDEQATTAQIPVNATKEFVDDMDFDIDFGSEIPAYGPTTVKMVNATKEIFYEDDLTKFQEQLLDVEKPLYKGCPDFTKLSAIVKQLEGITDGVLRHPADSQAWRTIDEKFLEIAKDPRNLRLGISADGIDVNSGTRHHKPLVDDLHTLFETGVDTYDASTKENVNLRAVVLCTINDYPALGTLCGCPYSGFKGCVVCGNNTHCVRFSASSKQSYAGHKRYLPYNHPFRRQNNAFNRQQEFQLALNPLIGEQIYNEERNQLARLDKMQEELVVTLCLLEKFFPLCMKVIKGHVRNRIRPGGCIAEETIAEETIEFFSEYHKTMKTIGIPPDEHVTNINKDEKPLSAGKSSEVFEEVFQKAHLYVIHNTDEIVPYIETYLSFCFAENTLVKDFNLFVNCLLYDGIKSLLDAVRITAAHICVTVAQLDLVLLMNFNEKNLPSVYYC